MTHFATRARTVAGAFLLIVLVLSGCGANPTTRAEADHLTYAVDRLFRF